MRHLLIVCNQPSANTQALARAAVEGAHHPDISDVEVRLREPLYAQVEDVLKADAVLIGTTENFGAMSGLIKDFFERIYYPCLEETQGKPFGLYVRAGNDGQGTLQGVQRITTGLRWKLVSEPLLLHGDHQDAFIDQVRELGMLMAAGLEASVF